MSEKESKHYTRRAWAALGVAAVATVSATAQVTQTFTGTGDAIPAVGNGAEFIATAEAGGYRISTPTNFINGTAQMQPIVANLAPASFIDTIGAGPFSVSITLDPSNAVLPDYDEATVGTVGASSGFNGTGFGIVLTFDNTGDTTPDFSVRVGWAGLDTGAGGGGISAMAFANPNPGFTNAHSLGGIDANTFDVSGMTHTIGVTRGSNGAVTLETNLSQWFNGMITGVAAANNVTLTNLPGSAELLTIGFYAVEEDGVLPATSGLISEISITAGEAGGGEGEGEGEGIRHFYEEGDTFTASIPGTANPPIQWSFDGTPLVNGGRISGANSGTLTITDLVIADTGDYTATYDDGSKAPASFGPVSITVVGVGSLPVAGIAALGLMAGAFVIGGAVALRRKRK